MRYLVRRRHLLLVAVAGVLMVPVLTAAKSGQARKVDIGCGFRARTSITLTADISNCPGDGIDAYAPGITIDLNGHTISVGNGVGVDIPEELPGITVENGTIAHFQNGGVRIGNGSSGDHILNVRLEHNAYGIDGELAGNAVIRDNVVVANSGDGIRIGVSPGIRVTHNHTEANSGDGINIADSGGIDVSNNTALNNTQDGIAISDAGDTPYNGTISDNTADGNVLNGITTTGEYLSVTGNRASFNGQLGIQADPGTTDGGGNTVQDNTTSLQCVDVVCVEVAPNR